MQHRYAGDIGDYGKFGLLKAIEQAGLSVGINWYLTEPDERELTQHADDGKHLIDIPKYGQCDYELANALYGISVDGANRSVTAIEEAKLLKTRLYYSDVLSSDMDRAEWHRKALDYLKDADVVFLDPDNGLLAKSVREKSKGAVKYVLDRELEDYLGCRDRCDTDSDSSSDNRRPQAVILYQHRPRKKQRVTFCGDKSADRESVR